MRVLLVQSYLGGDEPPVYPVGLACLVPALKGHEARVFDMNTSGAPFEELGALILDFSPDVIGISLRNIDSTNKRRVVFYYKYLSDMLDVIKETSSGARVVVGGSGFSMFAGEIMREEPRIDFGVFLEGEKVFPALLDNLESPENVKSVFFRRDGTVLFTGGGAKADLDEAALPDRTAVPLGAYKEVPEAIGVETKRGCVLECVYCVYGFLNGRKLRLRDPSKVVDEMEFLVNTHGVKRLTFLDSVFNIPRSHAEEVCREIIRRGLGVRWSAWFNEKHLTEDFLSLAVGAGCSNVILSPDGFSDRVLRKLGKDLRKEDILRAFDVINRSGVPEVSYNFFKNPPGQSLGVFISLVRFCLMARRRMGRRVHFEFNSMRVEPHTGLCRMAVEEGLVRDGESLLYPRYYTNRSTRYIEGIFNAVLRLKGK
jgi:radical SAM superfamily enzyme YgiQ (UPF0313 family)